jgi:hypothetical protein
MNPLAITGKAPSSLRCAGAFQGGFAARGALWSAVAGKARHRFRRGVLTGVAVIEL